MEGYRTTLAIIQYTSGKHQIPSNQDAMELRCIIVTIRGGGEKLLVIVKGTITSPNRVVRIRVWPSQRSMPSSPARRKTSSEAGISRGAGNCTVNVWPVWLCRLIRPTPCQALRLSARPSPRPNVSSRVGGASPIVRKRRGSERIKPSAMAWSTSALSASKYPATLSRPMARG
jgi:hypothetical protein